MSDRLTIQQIGRNLGRLPLGTVYYIACVETTRLKIGFTAGSVEKRLKALQTGAAGELRILACQPGTRDDEAALHTYFDRQRLHGEWFEMSEDLFDHLCSVIWNAAHFILKMPRPVEPWLALGIQMLEHQGYDLSDEIKALV